MTEHNKQVNNWELFWKKNPIGFNAVMFQSTLFFSQQFEKKFPIKSTDNLLDIGCGPGFFIDYVKTKFGNIHGIDISENYIDLCKNNFKDFKSLKFSVSKPYDYKAYHQQITENKINKVLILSVLQYYNSLVDVKNLIVELKKTASQQKFTCLLADISPQNHSAVSDVLDLVKHSFKKGYLYKFAEFIFYVLFSDYSKTKKIGILEIDSSFFDDLAQELDLDIKIIKNLTVHTTRYSVLITF